MKLRNNIRVKLQEILSSAYLSNSLKKILSKRKLKHYKKYIFIVAIILSGGAFYLNYSQKNLGEASPNKDTPALVKLAKIKQSEISFKTVTPNGKSIDSLGGWTKLNPPGSDLVAVYLDTLDSSHIQVSQQALPKALADDSHSKIKDFALSFGANQKIAVGDDNVYIGTSSNQAQSLIFAKNSLLILIKSDGVISNNSWLKYLESLK